MNKLWHWLLFFLFFGSICFSKYLNYHKKISLKSCKKTTTAIVTKKFKPKGQTEKIRYEYWIENTKYYDSNMLQNKKQIKEIWVGDSISINYSCDNKYISELNIK